jgi:xanthine dehydrogenase YagT iron-sulfur-binding subunit
MGSEQNDFTRRDFVGVSAIGLATLDVSSAAAAQNSTKYSLAVNGQNHSFELDPRVTLLDLLRERMHLTGTKKGCDHGQCGACTVLVDGVRTNSCLALAIQYDGRSITTIEGLASDEKLHPMQAAFIEHDGFQCGFCTPGQICSAVGLLKEVSGRPEALSDDEIRERMSGNICRCGAYANIVAAIQSVAQGKASTGRSL